LAAMSLRWQRASRSSRATRQPTTDVPHPECEKCRFLDSREIFGPKFLGATLKPPPRLRVNPSPLRTAPAKKDSFLYLLPVASQHSRRLLGLELARVALARCQFGSANHSSGAREVTGSYASNDRIRSIA
jgi:hypothetical protein